MRFEDYRKLRESAESGKSGSGKGNDEAHKNLHSNITLGDGNDFQPFVVSDQKSNLEQGGQHANLAPIIKAFKKGASWGATKEKESGAPKSVKISGKKLYLVGGSVRDIIMNRTPSDLDITTDATPEEIEKILDQNGFIQRDAPKKEDEHQERRRKQNAGTAGGEDRHDKGYYHLGKDDRGEPFVYGVIVNGEHFELATFRKDHKGGDNIKLNQVQHGTHADDAARRDLTINQMYIQLDNPDGENKKLIDHHGGIHDIRAGIIRFVGDAMERLKEDPIRALRAFRMAHRFGLGKGHNAIPETDQKALREILPEIKRRIQLPKEDPQKLALERVQAELKKGMSYDDVDPTKYLKSLEEFGLLDVAFPGMKRNLEFSKDMQGFHSSPHHMIAHMLRGNQDLDQLGSGMHDQKYSNDDINKVKHLIKVLRFNPEMAQSKELEQLMKSHLESGLSNKSVSGWMKAQGRKSSEIDALFQHFSSPRVKVPKEYEGGSGKFDDLLNPVTGKPIPATATHIGRRKRNMEMKNYQRLRGLSQGKHALDQGQIKPQLPQRPGERWDI